MTEHQEAYRQIEERVAAWADSRTDVHAALVVGSRARRDMSADEYSDLDMTLFADDPDVLMDSDDWLSEIGPVAMSFVEQTAVGDWRERRVVFKPMLDVDFSVVPTDLLNVDFAVPGPVTDIIRSVIDRGFRIAYDPSGRLAILRDAPHSLRVAWAPPDEPAFTNLVVDFWYHAMWTTKKALRGEILVARSCLDDSMKDKLLRVINWLAHLGKPDIDTWHGGRFFEQWSNQDIVETFHATYGSATVAGILDDLGRTMDLFSRVAREAASQLRYGYPEEAESHVRDWIRQMV